MHLPGPIRAVVGLAASAADEVKHLPDRAVELPMLAVSTALQMSLRAQQRYARLAARGEQVLSRERPTDEPPQWATFDEPVSTDELRRTAMAQLDSLSGGGNGRFFDELFGSDPAADAPDAGAPGGAPAADESDTPTATVTPISQAPAKAAKAAAKRAPAKKAATRRAPAKKAVTATDASGPTAGKTVSKPRHTAPSKFDDAGDD